MNIWVFLPALALVLGVLSSLYLFVEWIRYKRRLQFPLFWSLALFLMYWFQIPVILSNSGKVITVTDFNLFFALTLPITFLALFLTYLGSVNALGLKLELKTKFFLYSWLLASVIFFSYHFILRKGIIQTYSLPLVGNIAFYLPSYLLIVFLFLRWFSRTQLPKTTYSVLGALAIMAASVLGIIRNFIIIKNVLAYPPQFWYIVLTSSKVFFILQTFSILLLVVGFFFFQRSYHKANPH